jgi:hypothetical protein
VGLDDVVRDMLTSGTRHGDNVGDLISDMIERAGSRRAAAREWGIPESTLRRYQAGGGMSAARAEQILHAGREARINTNVTDENLLIVAKDRQTLDGRHRERKLDADKLDLQPGTMDAVRQAYVEGGEHAAAQALLNGIGNEWYRQWLTPHSPLAKGGKVSDGEAPGEGGEGGRGRDDDGGDVGDDEDQGDKDFDAEAYDEDWDVGYTASELGGEPEDSYGAEVTGAGTR